MKANLIKSLLVLAALTLVLAACGGKNNGTVKPSDNGGASPAPSDTPVEITFLNSKGQIQAAVEEAAKTFTAKYPHIKVNVLTVASGQSPFERASVLYSSGTPATLNMLDAGDIEKFADKALDLSGEKWIADLHQSNELNGQTIAFPFAIEGYGLVYNKAVVDKAVGGEFEPESVRTLADLEALFGQIEATGTPSFILGGMHWSLGNHLLPLSYVTQASSDAPGFLKELSAGTAVLTDNARFNGVIDALDLLKKHNVKKGDPLVVTADEIAAAVAKGEAAFTFNGNWMISQLEAAQPGVEYAFLPVPLNNDSADAVNASLPVGATKQIFIDKTKTSAAEQEAAKLFLNWIVYEAEGQDFLVNKASILPAFKNITLEPSDSLSKSIQSYMSEGKTLDFGANYVPGDHSKTVGGFMQMYVGDATDRAGLIAEIESYWKSK